MVSLQEGPPEVAGFTGHGAMAARCRVLDWSATDLGAVSAWSHSLRSTVSTMLSSPHPMFLWWGPELVQIFNDGYLPSFGTTGRDVTALGARGREHWSEIWPIIGPEIERVLMHAEAMWHEDHLVPIERNGRIEDVWWTYSYSPVFDDDGTVGGVLAIVQETTSRVLALAQREQLLAAERSARAEADNARTELARVFASAPVAIAVLHGRELRFTAANAKYQAIIGGRDPSGKRLTEMFPDLAGSDAERILENVYDTGVAFIGTDTLFHFDSQGAGSVDNYYDFVYHPLASTVDTSPGIVVVAVDVTSRHNALVERDQLLGMAEHARAEAESANRAKSEFLAVMSHELRTPLNAIGGYAELIELEIHGPVTAEQRGALGRIQTSQRHLLGLVNGVLNYARVEGGYVHYNVSDVLVVDVLATCEALIATQARAKRITLRFDAGDGRLTVRADPEKLQQIVLNLLTNAIKFTEPDGLVTVEPGRASEKRIEIRVRDTGIGIANNQTERIFQPFVQVDAQLTRTRDGVGLGLAISRDLARGMGGDLTVESVPGIGSCFTLALSASAQ